jgi:hypothetical protein
MAQRLALGMTLPSAAEQEVARVRLLAYAAGYISDPGDDDDTWFNTAREAGSRTTRAIRPTSAATSPRNYR